MAWAFSVGWARERAGRDGPRYGPTAVGLRAGPKGRAWGVSGLEGKEAEWLRRGGEVGPAGVAVGKGKDFPILLFLYFLTREKVHTTC